MKKILAIICARLLRFIGKLFKRGSSLPGKYALKIDPDILSELTLPSYVIAVTGSNGKTSTVEMIYQVLTAGGKKVIYNKEGSNQIEGVTTLLLSNCDIKGHVKCDVVLLESDERYARHTFKHFQPTHYVITNLYRDQMTRNGHPEWMYDIINESIYDKSLLILNSDDPLVSLFGHQHPNSLYFGINPQAMADDENISVYNDGVYCPNCKAKMVYDKHYFNHIGHFRCSNCNHQSKERLHEISSIDLKKGEMIIDGEYAIKLALKSLYNAYNILAAYTIACLLDVDKKVSINTLNNYILKNGRVVSFLLGDKEGTLLTSKHENSISYDQSLRVIANEDRDVTVLIIVDAISRKYFTSETSWLWDIDFDLLNKNNVKKIYLVGAYAADLAERFRFTAVDQKKIFIERDIEKSLETLKTDTIGNLYAVTCFSDQHKLLDRVVIR